MRDIVRDYLDGLIPRRAFMKRMSQAGFGVAAAASALKSLEPLARAQAGQATRGQGGQAANSPAGGLTTPFEGTGGELLAEQLRAAGVKFLFLGNGSGLGSLCDALVDRPDMQIILAIHEDHCVSIADGYSKASGKPGFAMFSRVGTPHATSNMYNAMKDRSSLIITSDHAESDREGRDGLEDIDNWLETVEQFTKFRWVVHEADRIPEWTMKAFKLATTMPGGPTYLRFPRDILYKKKVRAGIYPSGTFNIPMTLRPSPRDVEQAARILLEAKSPLLNVGYEVTASGAVASVVQLAELLAIPVTQSTSWGADFPTTHPLFLTSSAWRYPEMIDAYMNIGGQMEGSASEGGGRLRGAKIIHACVDAGHLGTAYPVHVALAANTKETATALVDAIKSMTTSQRLTQIRESRRAATEDFTKRMRESSESIARRQFGGKRIIRHGGLVPSLFRCENARQTCVKRKETSKEVGNYGGLRGWIEQVERLGELLRVSGAHWDTEMGAITHMLTEKSRGNAPAIVFDDIPGYPKGFRTLYGHFSSIRRVALTLGLPLEYCRKVDVVKMYYERMRNAKLLPPRWVKDGPVLENIIEGDKVDVLKFPVPRHHELDKTRYIGTANCVITQDPDAGWFNLGNSGTHPEF